MLTRVSKRLRTSLTTALRHLKSRQSVPKTKPACRRDDKASSGITSARPKPVSLKYTSVKYALNIQNTREHILGNKRVLVIHEFSTKPRVICAIKS